jgi:hypothetical protein
LQLFSTIRKKVAKRHLVSRAPDGANQFFPRSKPREKIVTWLSNFVPDVVNVFGAARISGVDSANFFA